MGIIFAWRGEREQGKKIKEKKREKWMSPTQFFRDFWDYFLPGREGANRGKNKGKKIPEKWMSPTGIFRDYFYS